ncbi:hypothetical protein BKA56DRAFT_361479 [Ilyonectria sp. MPI-CAGE-AT-0026]|nr:hypothetical protein BKA56DRAFT_361479 [Ilyonectria sp. MPI-CAGE-AT-0026]
MSEPLPPLSKVDSAVQGLSSSPPTDDLKKGHRRQSSLAPDVMNINELEEKGIDLELAPETQKTGWKINQSPNAIEDPAILKLPLTNPKVKKIDLHFKLGKEKRADDELDNPYLAGFEWDKEESWTQLVVHLQSQPTPTTFGASSGGGKKKKNKKEA